MENYQVMIITASDSCWAGTRRDESGERIRKLAEAAGLTVAGKLVLPDEQEQLVEALQQICQQQQADLILTTGGTGLSPRDCMPEATLEVADKLVPGIPEALRSYSLQLTKRGMLSRGVAVVCCQTLIINLPGSLKAVDESLRYLLDQLPHALGLLKDPAIESQKH